MAVAHIALNLGLCDHRGYRVDNHDVDRARAHKRLANLKRLLTGIRL